MCNISYLLESGTVVAGAACCVAAGLPKFNLGVVAGASIWSDKPPLLPTVGPIILIPKLNTINNMINVQVPFSRKSPVRYTPITLLPPARADDSAPPFGFWINTMIASKTLTIIITTMDDVVISLYAFNYKFFSNSSIRVGKYDFFSGYFQSNF